MKNSEKNRKNVYTDINPVFFILLIIRARKKIIKKHSQTTKQYLMEIDKIKTTQRIIKNIQ